MFWTRNRHKQPTLKAQLYDKGMVREVVRELMMGYQGNFIEEKIEYRIPNEPVINLSAPHGRSLLAHRRTRSESRSRLIKTVIIDYNIIQSSPGTIKRRAPHHPQSR